MAPGLIFASECAFESDNDADTPTKTNEPGHRAKRHINGDTFENLQSLVAEEYTYKVTHDDKKEIDSALSHFLELGLDGDEVNDINFPLPILAKALHRIAVDVHQGRGFANVRGLDLGRYSAEDNIIIYLGISFHIGEERAKQDEDGNMLMHICDAKRSDARQQDRPIRFSSRASTFHTDAFCDIIALQTRSCAARGGRNILASTSTVLKKMETLRPDLFDLLSRPIWPFDSRGNLLECNTRPLLYHHGGHAILNFAREPLIGLDNVARTKGLPEISVAQREALDLVETLAKENQIVLDVRPGDITFINNHAALHSREAFEDSSISTRYLIRMWLKNRSLAWKLPRPLQAGNARIYEKNEIPEHWNIVHVPKLRFKMSERLCS